MRILITGAAGSGTSTLAQALCAQLGFSHIEADDYFWLPTQPPFRRRRNGRERLAMLAAALAATKDAVVAGSIVGWGAEVEDAFDLIVFLYLDAAVRVRRLQQREIARYGRADPAFLEWAAEYDEGPPEGRSLAKHRAWLSERACPVVELQGELTVSERVVAVQGRLSGVSTGQRQAAA